MSAPQPANDPFVQRFVLNNARDEIEQAERVILDGIERQKFDPACCFAIRLALEEGLSNAFKHGNLDDPGKKVKVECCADERRIVIQIEDEGNGFDPEAVPDPTQQENMEIPAGRGLMLMRSFMSSVTVHPPGNRVEMVYECGKT